MSLLICNTVCRVKDLTFLSYLAPVVAPSDVGGGGGTSRELTITWTVLIVCFCVNVDHHIFFSLGNHVCLFLNLYDYVKEALSVWFLFCPQPVHPQYYYGSNFGYIIAFKPQNGSEWLKVTVADPRASRYIHKDPSIPPATKFFVKVQAFNSVGEGPYSLTAVIYSAQDGEYQRQFLFSFYCLYCFVKSEAANCVRQSLLQQRTNQILSFGNSQSYICTKDVMIQHIIWLFEKRILFDKSRYQIIYSTDCIIKK